MDAIREFLCSICDLSQHEIVTGKCQYYHFLLALEIGLRLSVIYMFDVSCLIRFLIAKWRRERKDVAASTLLLFYLLVCIALVICVYSPLTS